MGVIGLFGSYNRWNDALATSLEDDAAAIAERRRAPEGGPATNTIRASFLLLDLDRNTLLQRHLMFFGAILGHLLEPLRSFPRAASLQQ